MKLFEIDQSTILDNVAKGRLTNMRVDNMIVGEQVPTPPLTNVQAQYHATIDDIPFLLRLRRMRYSDDEESTIAWTLMRQDKVEGFFSERIGDDPIDALRVMVNHFNHVNIST